MTETAYAKINLALHVRRRRDDGYHELETLFAFVNDGDRLALTSTVATAADAMSPLPLAGGVGGPRHAQTSGTEGKKKSSPPPPPASGRGEEAVEDRGNALQDEDTLSLSGQFAVGLSAGPDNMVLAALASLPHHADWTLALDKRLPVAAGLGGGSADAGAVFRLIARTAGLPDDWKQIAARLGADVPACVASRTVLGRGTGTELSPGPQDLAGCAVLLVNPRLPLSTGPVFKAWDGQDRGPLPTGSAREIALSARNDLELPAISLCPEIAAVLAALRQTAPWLARMSGSGATCFALYDDAQARTAAAVRIAARHPGWWQIAGALR